MASLQFKHVSFSYDAATDGIFSRIGFGVSEGWTGVIGANGAGKTTLLHLACGLLSPKSGAVHRPPSIVYCPQRTDSPMDEFSAFLDSFDGEAYRLRGQLGIEDDWLDRWNTLSHGERKRAQIGTCLWLTPDLMAVDEPTNHLDRAAKRRVEEALGTFPGIGLLVSHNRDLLDDLCAHCLFVSPPSVVLRSGGYSTTRRQLEQETQLAHEARTTARQQRIRLQREAVERRNHVRKAEKKKSLRGVAPRDHDARAKARVAKIADGRSGKQLRQIEGRIRQAKEAENSINVVPASELGIRVNGSTSSRNTLLLEPAGSLPLGNGRLLTYPDLVMQPSDRIALTGPNGYGKSTLVRHLVSSLSLADDHYAYIPQEIPAEQTKLILDQARKLSGDRLGRTMAWVRQLGSPPERLLDSTLPSPGEVRKLLLALRLAGDLHLIVMDEPTNHMDLPSIECVEYALRDFPGALLLVSHDQRFLSSLTNVDWSIKTAGADGRQAVLSVHQRRP